MLPHSDNSDHFIAVRLNGSTWQYNNNLTWVNFTAVATDILVAELDFDADTVTSLRGIRTTIGGMEAGYTSGDLVFVANSWNGSFNRGEFEVSGTRFTIGSTTRLVGNLGNGVGVYDLATGTGYLMYSDQSVHTRFGSSPPHSDNSDHFIAVRFNGSTWQYNNNKNNNNSWVNFTAVATDVLGAEVNFEADTVTSLRGVSSTIGGMSAGLHQR